ncbi:MAG: alpha/beta hydrolase [Ilumatobacter sp.]|uniref:alpha/beta fold hydrolase n=1 Tax=Ilumatobacter sp. TaxID=1967498 RepID=UPI00329779EE
MREQRTERIATPSGVVLTVDHWPGTGSAVVLAHGGGQTRHSWGGTAATLSAHGHRVLSIDLRGHGDSDWSSDGDYSMGAYAADALAVVDWVGAPTAWVGASLGGMTGLHAVDARPGGFTSLTLVDITPRPAAAGVSRILEFMADRAHAGFASLDEAADAIAAYQPHRTRPTDLSGLAKNLRQRDGRWFWHWDPAFLSVRGAPGSEHARDRHHDELVGIARRLTLPTMLVRGRLSDLVTQDEVDAFLQMVPHARYVDVKDAAHMIAGDKNDVFTDAVVDFLASG